MIRAAILLLVLASGARAQGPPPPLGDSAAGVPLRVFLMTIGQGDAIWERFGHNAIWIRNEATGIDIAWNYGIFDFYEAGFVGRLVRGEMMYRLESYDANRLTQAYVESNRSVFVQELNLSPPQRAGLLAYLLWNDTDEQRFYRYDYYRDNCSTRVRDAIDHVLGGQLRASLTPRSTGTTYRTHTQRLLADNVLASTGTLLAMGPATDRPIDAWEESFLPVRLMRHARDVRIEQNGTAQPLVLREATLFEATREAEREQAPNRFLWYAALGAIAGGLLLLFGRNAPRAAKVRLAFVTIAVLWCLIAGLFGAVIGGLWAFTDHTFTYNNENLLQINALPLLLAVLVPLALAGRARGSARSLAALTLFLAGAGFVLQILPALDQSNGEIIALALPIHAGLFLGLRAATSEPSAP